MTYNKVKIESLLNWCKDNFEYEVPEDLQDRHVWLEVTPLIDDGEIYAVHSYITDGNNDLGTVDAELHLDQIGLPEELEQNLRATKNIEGVTT